MNKNMTYDNGPVLSKAFSGTGTSGTLVAAVSGFKIRILSICVITDTAATVNLQDNTGTPVEIFGPAPVSDNGGFVLPHNPFGWGETALGKQLDIILSASGTYGGAVTYQLVQ